MPTVTNSSDAEPPSSARERLHRGTADHLHRPIGTEKSGKGQGSHYVHLGALVAGEAAVAHADALGVGRAECSLDELAGAIGAVGEGVVGEGGEACALSRGIDDRVADV